jgi:hypothetical protein
VDSLCPASFADRDGEVAKVLPALIVGAGSDAHNTWSSGAFVSTLNYGRTGSPAAELGG